MSTAQSALPHTPAGCAQREIHVATYAYLQPHDSMSHAFRLGFHVNFRITHSVMKFRYLAVLAGKLYNVEI